MKKAIAILTAFILMVSVAACGTGTESDSSSNSSSESSSMVENNASSSETSSEPSEDAPADSTAPLKYDCEDGTLEYLSYEITEDYEGKPAITLHFNFTNKMDEAQSVQTVFYPKVFQNGVECEMAIVTSDSEASSNTIKSIQKDTTLEVALSYSLQDTTSAVDLEVQALSEMFTGDPVKQTINLQ